MKRYDLEAEDCMGGWASRDVMNERDTGDWVRYEDAAAKIEQLEADLASALNVAQWFRKAEARRLELEAAIDKLAACKGRYHTEANFKELIAVREKGRVK